MKKILFLITFVSLFSSITFSQNISNALEFDGIDDYVSIPNGTGLISGLTEFSMCGWVYPTNPNTAWPDFEGYFGIKNEGVCDFYLVQLYGLGLEARITTNEGQFTINPADLSEVDMEEWQHFALVYTGDQLQVFINGEFDNAIAASGVINYEDLELTIGTLIFGSSNFYLDGKVDEVTVWDKALTEEEVQDYMCITGDPYSIPNLTAYYNFNEVEGMVLPDYFEGYHGILTGMTGEEWIVSEVCESGFDATFIVTDSDTNEPVEGATIDVEGLVKTTDENGEAVFSNYDPGEYDYTITKTDYYDFEGSFEIVDDDIEIEVSFDPILTYSITFFVKDNESNAVENAIVNLDGLIQYTNASGETVFDDYLPGSYPYSVIVEGFEFVSGDAIVDADDIVIEINLVINNIIQSMMQGVHVFPNPSSGIVNIEVGTIEAKGFTANFRDASGKTIRTYRMKPHQNRIDLSDLKEGMYIIEFEIGDNKSYVPIFRN